MQTDWKLPLYTIWTAPDQLVEAYGQDAVDEAARNVKVMNFLVDHAVLTPAETE